LAKEIFILAPGRPWKGKWEEEKSNTFRVVFSDFSMDGWMDGSKKKRVRSILRHASILMMCLACLLMQWLIKCGRVVGARVKTSFDNVLDVYFAADVGVGKGNLHRCARSALERKMGRRKINDFQIGVPRFYHA
jgi:hypothetical protein